MQLVMNASHAPRRNGNVACSAFSKQKASVSNGAAEAGLTNARKVTATSTHFGFNVGLLTVRPRLAHQFREGSGGT
jgi:hypothetical protein